MSVSKAFVLALLAALASSGQQDTPSEHVLLNRQFVVPAGQYYQVPFAVQTYFRRARLAGNITSSGGSGNDIRVLVMKDSRSIFDSGQRRSIVLSVDCDEPGQYKMIFDNRSSVISNKLVTATIRVVEWGIDQNEIEKIKRRSQHVISSRRG